jgi:hypothetical protein
MVDTNAPQYRDRIASRNPTFKLPHDLNVNYSTSLRFVKSTRATPASEPGEEPTGTLVLPLPNNLPETYSIGYNNPALGNIINEIKEIFIKGGTLTELAGSADLSADFLNKVNETLTSKVKDRVNNVTRNMSAMDTVRAAAAFAPKQFYDTAIGAAVAQQLGVIPNPHMTTVFSGIGPRTGELRWKFSPKSKGESRQFNDMIRFIREHIHPSIENGGLTLAFPDEVYIDFFPSEFLIPYKKSVITNFVVQNTPSGRPVFYEGGAPVEVDVIMTVQEVTPRTREDFR